MTALQPSPIRWMIRADLKEVLAIEKACFECPWDEDEYVSYLGHRHRIGMVYEPTVSGQSKGIRAYMLYELHHDGLELDNMAVDPHFQREGYGWQMIDKLRDKLSQQRRTWITVKVREGNLEAQLFFKAMGFRCVDVLPAPYEVTDEDAYLFRYDLPLDDAEDAQIVDRAIQARGRR